jgi:hypothetical protein
MSVLEGGFRNQASGQGVVFAVRPAKVFAHAKGERFGATMRRLESSAAGAPGAPAHCARSPGSG